MRVLGLATTACLVMGGLCAASLWRATRPVALPAPDRARGTAALVTPAPRHSGVSDADVVAAIDHDPFAPDRHRPGTRYQLPEEIAAAAAPAPTVGLPHLLGTVVSPGGASSFAMCQTGTEAPKVVRIGGVFNGLTLEHVSQGAASFRSPGGSRIELTVTKASGS